MSSSSSSSGLNNIRRLLLLSNSTQCGSGFLEHCTDIVKQFFTGFGTQKVLFVPYAHTDFDNYAAKVRDSFEKIGFSVESIHEFQDPVDAVKHAQGIFVGGGNTFRLLRTLFEKNLVDAIRIRVLEDGMPYMGASAGSNVATVNICTTNDMPIFYPPTFNALNLIPININPHYIESNYDSPYMGETRDQRIFEYLEVGNHIPVLGMKEGSLLWVEGNTIKLLGVSDAKLFREGADPVYYKPGSDLSFLLTPAAQPQQA
ncbi:alpha-aspartyl dipeptidase-like [Ornithodoros turicata]|uniref:alpha-aspartyl dipeptidase-like n=1 Tax=Ornithodoros turicata TaxID=34597 RepID=UPI0031393D35